ncbi:MAG: sigma-54 dependent transcriptional regulator [Thermoguttaceae bacterium]|jgi:DNA-binding NtrC family response regulator
MSRSILVVSRNAQLAEQLRMQFHSEFEMKIAEDLKRACCQVESMSFPVVLVHWGSPTQDGLSRRELLADVAGVADQGLVIGLIDPDCPPQLRELAATAMPQSLELPFDPAELNRLVSQFTQIEADLEAFCRSRPHRVLRGQTRSLVIFTEAMFGMLEEIKVAGDHGVPILLVGETGCGKTYLARLMHELSSRRKERCLTVACGALPPNLIESELFGYVKGAFTGADQNRPGKFAAAENGTLILDEIDVLTPDQQAKLLRVIETGEYEAVGSNDTKVSRAALIAGSNVDLEELVAAGKFRKDFFYRLNTLSFVLPPLRERVLDIQYLVWKFALEHSRSYRTRLWRIEPEFLEVMQQYSWPGNIRELENVMRRACLYCRDGVLKPSELPSNIRENTASSRRGVKHDQESAFLERCMKEVEYRVISESLQRNNFRRSDTAVELGISRVTLYNKMRRLGILDSLKNVPESPPETVAQV